MVDRPFRGVFTIPVTPFTDSGILDIEGLKEVVGFCIAAGAHGLVTPVNASEFQTLSDAERRSVVETVANVNRGRLPFVAGVSGVSSEVAIEFARHAFDLGANALIAMPPYVRKPHLEGIRRYFNYLSFSIELPIFVQNYPLPIGVPMSPNFLKQIACEIPRICYIKEELPPVTHRVSADLKACGDLIDGVFGGAAGKFMLDEMRRGAIGTMPACDVTDLHVGVWNAYQKGDKRKARDFFNRLLPLLNFESLYGVNAYKEVIRRRGVIRSATVRVSVTRGLDASDMEELDVILSDLEDLFTI